MGGISETCGRDQTIRIYIIGSSEGENIDRSGEIFEETLVKYFPDWMKNIIQGNW